MNDNSRIVYLGTPQFAVAPLRAMVEAGYNVVAVVTNRDQKVGRKQILTPPPVKEYALSHDIPVYQYDKIRLEGAEDLRALNPDLMITCAFGQILSQEILDIPTLGVYNLHGSLLPKFRGASPVQSAILAGEKETGVTVMKTDVGLDTGAMLLKKPLPISRQTADELFLELSPVAAEALLEALPQILEGRAVLTPQNEALATKTALLKKETSGIDWNRSAEEIDCFVRGLNGWPVAFTTLNGEIVKVYFGTPVAGEADFSDPSAAQNVAAPGTVLKVDKFGVSVACGRGVYRMERLQFPGGKQLSGADIKNGKKFTEGSLLSPVEAPL